MRPVRDPAKEPGSSLVAPSPSKEANEKVSPPGSDHDIAHESNDTRYDVFISYRHTPRDRKWAIWLHRALESYRTPQSLVRQGKAVARLKRSFRDEEELSASSDLSKEIDDALRQSRFLIVICSPRTPGSLWCNEEIVRFRQLGRDRRILSLLIEGEPSDSFPRALCEIRSPLMDPAERTRRETVEPLAADVRAKPGESKNQLRRTALLRLLAPILNVRFDDLRQRDAERRTRQLKNLVAASIFLLVLMAGLTIFALIERQVAVEQEATANRKSIEAVSQAHLTELSRSLASEQLSLALQALDRVTYQLQQPHPDTVSGQEPWRNNLQNIIADSLRKMAADDRYVLAFQDPQSAEPLIQIGNTLFLANRLEDARDIYARAVQLLSSPPPARHADFQLALVRALVCLARAERCLGNTDVARQHVERAQSALDSLDSVRAVPTNPGEHCVLCLLRASLELDAQNAPEADRWARKALDLAKRVEEAFPGDPPPRALVTAHTLLGDALLMSNRSSEALNMYDDARKSALRLLEKYPRDNAVREDLAFALARAAQAALGAGKNQQVPDLARQSIDAAQVVLTANPSSRNAALAKGVAYAQLAALARQENQTAESNDFAARARSLLEPLQHAEAPWCPADRRMIASMLDHLVVLEAGAR